MPGARAKAVDYRGGAPDRAKLLLINGVVATDGGYSPVCERFWNSDRRPPDGDPLKPLS